MSTLTGKKISQTYEGLLKTSDETPLSATPKAITDGLGNSSGIKLDTNGNLDAENTISFGSLKDTAENITINKFIDQADGIANNDDDVSLPTSAAVKNYVDEAVTAEDLDFSGNSGTGDVDLDSEAFQITGSNGITTTALDNTLDINGSALETSINTNTSDISTNATNITANTTLINERTAGITIGQTTDGERAKDFTFQTVNFGGTPNSQFIMSQQGKFTTKSLKVENDFESTATENKFLNNGRVEIGSNQQTSGASNLSLGLNNRTNSNYTLISGTGNEIRSSINSFIAGQGNVLIESPEAVALGEKNTIQDAPSSIVIGEKNYIDGGSVTQSSVRSQAFGFGNQVEGFSSMAVGGQNQVTTAQTGYAFGFKNNIGGDSSNFAIGENNKQLLGRGGYMIGGNLNGQTNTMVLGYRNDTTKRPTPDQTVGLSDTRFEIGVGDVNDHTAMIITEGGATISSVPQIARIILPTIVAFDYETDTTAAQKGIPIGGLYHFKGNLRIRIT